MNQDTTQYQRPFQPSEPLPALTATGSPADDPGPPSRILPRLAILFVILCVLVLLAVAGAALWLRSAARGALPQLDGSLTVQGLAAPVTIQRDRQGIPHITAQSVDDAVFAQGFVTAQDRLFQMDLLRRHAAGDLAAVLGRSALPHDETQRTLLLRDSAQAALAELPAEQLHLLERYASGVNASIAAQQEHLPVQFRILRYRPAPWATLDSLLISLAMFQDLTNSFPAKLARDAMSMQLPSQLLADLYPVGSWRDHPPSMPVPDLSVPGPPILEVPLDESQSRSVQPIPRPVLAECSDCRPGSNNWVVSGAHTVTGKPMLSNDMHLSLRVPGVWYEVELDAGDALHVGGVSLPGLPLVVVGHNQHVAWGFTNLGADVQDVYVETVRGQRAQQEYQAADGTWHLVEHTTQEIAVRGGLAVRFDVASTRHGSARTPVLNPVLAPGMTRGRVLTLRWTMYDPSVLRIPFLEVDTARDWASFTAAFATFGGPAQNVVYADDQGHIGYHAVGRIPLRGAPVAAAAGEVLPSDVASPVEPRSGVETPAITAAADPLAKTAVKAPAAPAAVMLSGPLSPVPLPTTAAREWSGYIPYEQLPQVYDPKDGVIATANARVAADDYGYPITLNWAAPYRNERIWQVLGRRTGLSAADMLRLQMDVYSDFDHVLAQRLAYALDHSPALAGGKVAAREGKVLRQAADLLRTFDGRMTVDSPAAAIVASVHAQLWPMLLAPHLAKGRPVSAAEINALYLWGEKDYALEQVLMHTPQRWLPKGFSNWDDFLTEAVVRGLREARAPEKLAGWRYGAIHTMNLEDPVFQQSALLRRLLGMPTGTGEVPMSGDGTTVKQVGHTFGPSERFTADLGDPDASTLNVVLGESGQPASPYYRDQWSAWYRGTTFPFAFSREAADKVMTHSVTLMPVR